MSREEPPWLFSESTSPLSSAFYTPRAPHSDLHSNNSDGGDGNAVSVDREFRCMAGNAGPTQFNIASLQSVSYTEPHGSVLPSPLRCLIRSALGCHPTRRSGAARACRRFDHGPCREVPHDPHGHEE